MRDFVDVVLNPQGTTVRFTRAQVKKAVADLNAPDPLKNLDRVFNKWFGFSGVVLKGRAQERYASTLAFSKTTLTIVSEHGSGYSYLSDADARRTGWEVAQ